MKTTPETIREQVALTRFKAVNHIDELVRNGIPLAEALRQAAVRPWPDESGRCYAPRTIEDWYYAHRHGGFGALQPRRRADRDRSRVIDEKTAEWIIEQVRRYPGIQVKVLYDHWMKEGRQLPSLRSVYRHLKRRGYDRASLRRGRLETGPTKAFEAPGVNDLWMVDFSPGPRLQTGDGMLGTHLCVLVDDCSRLIPFAAYFEKAGTRAFMHTLREAVLRRGLPRKLYTDQGKPFVCHHTRVVCANLGIRLLHAKPYHSWSKGKCERLIRTIQQGFESTLRIEGNRAGSLEELNRRLSQWIQTAYHQRVHSATGSTPENRYQEQLDHVRRLECEPFGIDHLFYTRIERTARKDGTVRIDNILFEVDLSLRTERIELRFDPFSFDRIEVWHRDRFAGCARPCNLNLNSYIQGVRHDR